MHWGLMFLHNSKIIGEQDFHKDQFFVYNGMYGIPSHCIWYCAPDKNKEIYLGIGFRLFFYNFGNNLVYVEDFVIQKSYYNISTQMFEIYAISQVFDDLITTNMFTYKKFTDKSKRPQLPKKTLKDFIENTFPNLEVSFDKNVVERFGYLSFSFDISFSALDLLTKICAENQWEWYLKGNSLFISESLAIEGTNIIKVNPEPESAKIIHFGNYKYVEIPGDTAEPGCLYGENGRVIWVRYTCGGEISGSMGLMIQKNKGTILYEGAYLETLFGISEGLITERRIKNFSQNPIILGKVFGEFKDRNKEEYEAPKFSGDLVKFDKWIKNREYKNRYGPNEPTLLYSEDVLLTTPYAGKGVGIQYPQDESHHILFSPNGDREEPLIGPAFFGNNDDIPLRDSVKDYRLTLPGATIYIKEDGEIIIEQIAATADVPTGTGSYIKILTDGTMNFHSKDKAGVISINEGSVAVSTINHKHGIPTHTHQIPLSALITGPPAYTAPDSSTNTSADPDKNSDKFRVVEV